MNTNFDEKFYSKLFSIIRKYKKININYLLNKLNFNLDDLKYILIIIKKNPCSWYNYGIIDIDNNIIKYYKNYKNYKYKKINNNDINFISLKII